MAEFVNPYNFIPLGKGNKDKANRRKREEVYCGNEPLKSGWINVSMYVKTPLIVPDGAHPKYYDVKTRQEIFPKTDEEKDNAHKEYEFYHVKNGENKTYIVPGSELRGMIRSMYEAVTDSCFPFLLNDKPMSQRVPAYASLNRRGLLEYDKDKNQWLLWKTTADKKKCSVAQNRIFWKNTECFNGDYFEGLGYLQCNIPVSNKDKYHIAFLKKSGSEPEFEWEKGDIKPYKKIQYVLEREGVKGNQKNPNETQVKSLYNHLKDIKEHGGMIPVWFFTVIRNGEKKVYFSNSSIGRIAQERQWKDIFENHVPCSDTEHLCPACMLFGTIYGEGMKGRVRFTDAECLDQTPKMESFLLNILGEPRTSAFEFYLNKPASDATYWNFDFYGHKVRGGDGKAINEYVDLSKATPRGRKMYWHAKPGQANYVVKNAHLYTTMEGALPDTKFKFKIYFDRITQKQLEDLIWVITLGENDKDSSLHHKLGHAKPLGYGSVKLLVDGYYTREIENRNGDLGVKIESHDAKEVKCSFDMSSDIYRSIMAMCDASSTKDKEVRYPQFLKESKNGKKDDSVYQWFTNNRKNADYVKVLPKPYAKTITLNGSWITENYTQQQSLKLSDNVYEGTINKVTDKGFGFITYKKGSIFFHCSELRGGLNFKSLKEGDIVYFEEGRGKKGNEAKNVRK